MDRTRRSSTSWWSCITPTYSLSPSRTASSARVASARATGRTPVTRGSRVPEWPAFGTPNMSRTHALTWWDVGPAGLSAIATPRRIRSSIDRSSGLVPYFESGTSWRTTRSLIPPPARRSSRRSRPGSGPRVDREIEDPGVPDVDSVDRFVPDPLRPLAPEDLAFRLLHGCPLPTGDSSCAHRKRRVDEHLETRNLLFREEVRLNPSIDHDVPALGHMGPDLREDGGVQ